MDILLGVFALMRSWQHAQERLKKALGGSNFDTWIRPLRLASSEDGQVLLEVPSKFYRDWITRNYLDALKASFIEDGQAAPEIQFRVESTRQRELFQAASAVTSGSTEASGGRRRRANARVGGLVSRFTFKNFVVGPSNQFAHAAALAVAKKPGDHYNPLFIYGAVGIGKTHLANAIGHRVLESNPAARVVFLSSEAFVNEMIASLKRDRMDDFKNRFRKVDLLIVDDVQFLAGRERTQEEFFHTFNTLHEARKQIVLTSDKFPKDIPDLEERLRNRFTSGLAVDIQAPDFETRTAIAQKKCDELGLSLPDEVSSFIAEEIGDNVRELEGALTRLVASSSLQDCEISLRFARETLKPHFKSRNREVGIAEIQSSVADFYGISVEEMNSKKRTQNIAPVRQLAMYLSRKLTNLSYPMIGEHFGRRHHSTVMHAYETVGRRISIDPALSSAVSRIEDRLARGGADD